MASRRNMSDVRHRCEYCRRQVNQHKRADAVYCSPTCAARARDDRRRFARRLRNLRPCPTCGWVFAFRRSDAVYCSARCRVAAHRARHSNME